MADEEDEEFHTPTPAEKAARKRRNLYVAGALIAFIVIVFLITVIRLQEHSLTRPF
jgi:hypothetical protein